MKRFTQAWALIGVTVLVVSSLQAAPKASVSGAAGTATASALNQNVVTSQSGALLPSPKATAPAAANSNATTNQAFVTNANVGKSSGQMDANASVAPSPSNKAAKGAAINSNTLNAAAAATEAQKPVSPNNLKLREIEERVNELKEKVFQSKARLLQLQEVVLHGTVAGAKAVLIHRNEMGSSFKLVHVEYALDGATIFNRVDAGNNELEAQAEIEAFNGAVSPGAHQISVYLEYKGHGFGIFSYLEGYDFRIKSSYSFNVEEGKQATIRIVGYEKGGLTTQLRDRPSVRYDAEPQKDLRALMGNNKALPADASDPNLTVRP